MAYKFVFEAIMNVDDNLDLDQQADQVQVLATEFGDLFQHIMPGASGGVYMHILVRIGQLLLSASSHLFHCTWIVIICILSVACVVSYCI